VTLTGSIGSTCFESVDSINVIAPRVHHPCDGDRLIAGAPTNVQWDVDPDALSMTLMSSLDDGATWNLVARDVPNTGSYTWMVPSSASGTGRLQLVANYPPDETGAQDPVDFTTSDAFSIQAPAGIGMWDQTELALQSLANPTVGALRVTFVLPTSLPASLTVFDVTGRVVSLREIGDLGAGVHTVSLDDQMPAGMYVVRLAQAGHSRTARVTVIR
jgi:hypothetical protein